jgi:hypothetical protein
LQLQDSLPQEQEAPHLQSPPFWQVQVEVDDAARAEDEHWHEEPQTHSWPFLQLQAGPVDPGLQQL